jgi:guanine deaminase
MVEAYPAKAYRFETLQETLQKLEQEPCKIIAGGTDVMVMHKGASGCLPSTWADVVFIDHLKELKSIEEKENGLYIGAACTYSELLQSDLVPSVLKKAIKQIASPAIRNRGTIGGNLCNASPAGDTLPLLTLFNAKLVLACKVAKRMVSIQDFILGPRKIALKQGELLTHIYLPRVLEEYTEYVFEKVGNRKADAIAKVSFVGGIRLKKDTISDIRFAFGAVGPTIVRCKEIEKSLIGAKFPLEQGQVNRVVEAFKEVIHPIDDQRSTATYRKKVALGLLRTFLETKQIQKRVAYKGHIMHTPTQKGLEVYPNHYLLVENGCVVEIQEEELFKKEQRFRKQEEAYTVKDYTDHLIIPGFVDLHVHASQYEQIGLGLDLELVEWLENYTFKEEAKFKDPLYAKGVYEKFVEELIRNGTTRACIYATIHKESTKVLMEILQEKGMSAYVGKVNMDQNAHELLMETTEESLKETIEWIEETKNWQEVKPILTPRFSPSCSEGLLQGLGELAKTYELPVQSHLSESPKEIAWVKELFPWSENYSHTYEKQGLFGQTKTLMAHAIYLTEEEIKMVKQNNVMLVHCPDSNMNLCSGIMPLSGYMEQKINIGLGSDVGGGSKMSMNEAITSAIQNTKLLSLQIKEKSIAFHEAFYLATKAGGSFFGKVGSFEKGYIMDALVIDLREDFYSDLKPEEQLMRFVYRNAVHCIKESYCNGVPISKNKNQNKNGEG